MMPVSDYWRWPTQTIELPPCEPIGIVTLCPRNESGGAETVVWDTASVGQVMMSTLNSDTWVRFSVPALGLIQDWKFSLLGMHYVVRDLLFTCVGRVADEDGVDMLALLVSVLDASSVHWQSHQVEPIATVPEVHIESSFHAGVELWNRNLLLHDSSNGCTVIHCLPHGVRWFQRSLRPCRRPSEPSGQVCRWSANNGSLHTFTLYDLGVIKKVNSVIGDDDWDDDNSRDDVGSHGSDDVKHGQLVEHAVMRPLYNSPKQWGRSVNTRNHRLILCMRVGCVGNVKMVFETFQLSGRFYTLYERIGMFDGFYGSHQQYVLLEAFPVSVPESLRGLVIAYCQQTSAEDAMVTNTLTASTSLTFSLSWLQLAVVELPSKQPFTQLLLNLHWTEQAPVLAVVLLQRYTPRFLSPF